MDLNKKNKRPAIKKLTAETPDASTSDENMYNSKKSLASGTNW